MTAEGFDLDELERIRAKAAPGPIRYDEAEMLWICPEDPCEWHGEAASSVDGRYFEALHNAYPAMAAEIRRLREENERLRSYVQQRDGSALSKAQEEHGPLIQAIVERVEKHGTERLVPFLQSELNGLDWSIAQENAALRAELEERTRS